MKNTLINFTILVTLVSCVFLARRASEDGNRNFLTDGAHETEPSQSQRILASTPRNYTKDACANVANASAFITSSQQSVEKINSALFGTYRSVNYLDEYIMKTGISTSNLIEYAKSFISIVVPWIALWLLGILFNVIFCCNQCCMVGCCKNCCKCCKCCKKPKEDRKIVRGFSAIIAMVAAAGVLGSAAAGLAFSMNVTSDYDNLMCAFYSAFDAFVLGNSTGQWTGVDGASKSVATVDSQFYTTFSGTTLDTSTLITDVETASTTLKNSLESTYNNYKDNTVSSAALSGGTAVKPDIITVTPSI